MAKPSIVIDSTTANGSSSMSTRSLNVPGLGLVGVAHDVVRLGRLRRDGRPLAAGRERGAAAAERASTSVTSWMTASGPIASACSSATIAAVREVLVERGGVDDADPPQQLELGSPTCGTEARAADAEARRHPRERHPVRCRGRGSRVAPSSARAARRCPRRRSAPPSRERGVSPAIVNIAAGASSHSAEAGAAEPADPPVARGGARRPERALEVAHSLLGAGEAAGDVVADVGDGRRPRLRGEQA